MIETIEQITPSIEFTVSELSFADSLLIEAHTEYIENGGKLCFADFQTIIEYESSSELDHLLSQRSYHAYNFQAIDLGAHAKIGLSGEEIQLYMLLRNKPVSTECTEVKDSLSDQGLMAEVLRITAPDKMAQFTSRYPHIFPE